MTLLQKGANPCARTTNRFKFIVDFNDKPSDIGFDDNVTPDGKKQITKILKDAEKRWKWKQAHSTK